MLNKLAAAATLTCVLLASSVSQAQTPDSEQLFRMLKALQERADVLRAKNTLLKDELTRARQAALAPTPAMIALRNEYNSRIASLEEQQRQGGIYNDYSDLLAPTRRPAT